MTKKKCSPQNISIFSCQYQSSIVKHLLITQLTIKVNTHHKNTNQNRKSISRYKIAHQITNRCHTLSNENL